MAQNTSDDTFDRAAGALLGLAIGDALGAPVEFQRRDTFEPVTDMRSGGYFKLPAGAWTDDTAIDERQPCWPVPTTTLAGGSGRKTGMPVWRAAPPA